jgi:hypothetical protein
MSINFTFVFAWRKIGEQIFFLLILSLEFVKLGWCGFPRNSKVTHFLKCSHRTLNSIYFADRLNPEQITVGFTAAAMAIRFLETSETKNKKFPSNHDFRKAPSVLDPSTGGQGPKTDRPLPSCRRGGAQKPLGVSLSKPGHINYPGKQVTQRQARRGQ